MNNFFDEYTISIGSKLESPFMQKSNNYQDGTTPMYRDVDGRLWAMSGHSHMGAINVFCGTCLDDMKKLYEIHTNFCVGNAEYAFSGIRYPDGNKPVGSIWPFGLYICPNTHRFFCFFHKKLANLMGIIKNISLGIMCISQLKCEPYRNRNIRTFWWTRLLRQQV